MTSKTKTTTPPANVDKAPSVPAPATPIVTIETRDLLPILKSFAPMAEQPGWIPSINGIRMSRHGDRAKFLVTDRFVVALTSADAAWEKGTVDFSILIPLSLCKKIVTTWSRQAKSFTWPLTISTGRTPSGAGHVVTVCDVLGESITGQFDPEHPEPVGTDKLFSGDAQMDGDPDYAIGLNFDYLVKFQKLVRRRGEGVYIQWPETPARPVRITVGGHTTGLIMPIRITDGVASLEQILSGGAA